MTESGSRSVADPVVLPGSMVFPIDVVIVNYCTAKLVIDCLESLAAQRTGKTRLQAIVVDNNSGDGSVALLRSALETRGWDWVTLIASHVNAGFGAGCNVGIDYALGSSEARAIWLLNPDTRVMPDAVDALASFMASTPRAGIAGTALLQEDGTAWPYAFRFPGVLSELERAAQWRPLSRLLRGHAVPVTMDETARSVDWVCGASMAVRRELLDDGLRFDEDFFLYYEETDFCRSASARGWQCWYAPAPVVLHIAGQSTGVTASDSGQRPVPQYWFESRRHYFRKNHGLAYALAADLAWIVGHIGHMAKSLLKRNPQTQPPRLLRDFIRFGMLAPRRP